ncbi:MAG: PQQ-binding-like beta-propeller repeat protein [Verrucomicrobiales bacterium]|nr:PQQ-binding-like beta-propeller repeat protein [Verrucomicrobiales bacterium]
MHRLLVALCLGWVLQSNAEDWPRFRGPTGQGWSAEKDLPREWSADRGIVWKTPIPGEGWSSPIVWGDRVYVSTATEANTQCRLLCLDRATGKIVWNTAVVEIVPLRKESKNSYATPTPVTDGERIYVAFGDGTVAAVDVNGRLVWKNQEVRFYSRHGLGASPLVHDGLLIMPFDGSNRVEKPGEWPNNSAEEQLGWRVPWDQAQVVAFDVKTGERRWKGNRGKSRIAHVSPNVVLIDGVPQIVSPAGDAIQGFDPKTGERLWTVYSQGEGVTPSFAHGDGLIFTSSGFEKTTLRTVRVGGKGDVTASHVAWEQRKGTPTQPSLLYVSPHLYGITDGGIVHCYDGKTGEVIYAERVGGNHSASPVYADGHIYFLSETAETTVVKAGPKFEIVARNPLNEKCQASIAVSRGHLFLRTEKHLFCIGK